LTLAGTLAAAVGAACLEERPRPAPPLLALALDAATVCTPDTLTGRARAEDPDGIDSLWIATDQSEEGVDGLLERVFETRFRLPVRGGLATPGSIEVVVRARDIAGFSDTLRRTVAVIACTAIT
jgi:hypothetical protein